MHQGPGRFGNYSTPGDPNLDVRAVAKSDTLTLFFLVDHNYSCLLYTSDAADERSSVDLGGRRIIKKKKQII